MIYKTLILSSSEVRRLIRMPEAIKCVRKAFSLYGKGLVEMPPKIYIHLEKYGGDFRAMPAYLEGPEACGLKWVNVHPANRRLGLPSVMATIILSDPKTGLALSIMDGTYITYLRTGAAGGIAAKCLARPGSGSVAIIGCGAQGMAQLEAIALLFRMEKIFLYDADPKRSRNFLTRLESRKLHSLTWLENISVSIAPTIRECVKEADIVVTTTPSRKPIIKSDWIRPGTHINAIGADATGKEELDPALLRKAKIVVDDVSQASHSGEINVPLSKGLLSKRDIYATIGQILAGSKKAGRGEREITVFDSTGLAIQDIAVAQIVYKKALRRGLGKRIKLF